MRISPSSGWFLAFGAAFIALYFLIPERAVQNLLYQLPGMLGAVAIVIGARRNDPNHRRPWLLLALGVGLTSLGDWTWVWLEAQGLEPIPSIADAIYLLGMTLTVTAVLLVVRGRVPGGDYAGLLDGLIVAVSVGIVSWTYLMAPILTTGARLEDAVALAYPMLDLVVLAVLVRLVLAGVHRKPALALLSAAMAAQFGSDMLFAFLATGGEPIQTGQLVEVGWLATGFLWGAAALHPSMRELAAPADPGEVPFSRGRLALLAAALLLAPALLVVQWVADRPIDVPVIAGGSMLLILLVLARLAMVVTDLRATLNERQLLERELERRALHDPLTGLANRVLFRDRLEQALTRRAGQVAVLFLDLDDFKTVNDAGGHMAGDEVLCAAAESLRSTVRAADTVARLGGDEFAVLLEDDPDATAATMVAERLLEAVGASVSSAGRVHVVRASIGVALGASGHVTADELMRQADVAMYLAKARGKNGFAVFVDDPAPTGAPISPARPVKRPKEPAKIGEQPAATG